MLILLPPSETKDRPSPYADPMELGSLSLPALTTARQSMLRAVQRTATGADGAARLGVPASAPELTERMAHLDQERSEEHTSELQSRRHLLCRLLLEKQNK